MTFQHYWKEYGITFANESLLSATLAMWISSDPTAWKSSSNGEVSSYLSRFQKSMITAIEAQEVSEYHLIAIFAVLCTPILPKKLRETHLVGFVAVLRRLVNDQQGLHSSGFRLYYIYYYLLQHVHDWIVRNSVTLTKYRLLFDLRDLSRSLYLPFDAPDLRIANVISLQDLQRRQLRPELDAICASLQSNEVNLLQSALRIFRPRTINGCNEGDPRRLWMEVERNLKDISSLPMMKNAFRWVDSTQSTEF